MGTFHSIFSRILRAEAQHIGFTNNFTIYDESDSRSLIKTIVKEMGLDEKVYKPASVHSRISMAKNNLMSADNSPATRNCIKPTSVPKCHVWEIFSLPMCSVANRPTPWISTIC